MNELIEALTILNKYETASSPTHCEHDVLYVLVDHTKVSEEDKKRLDELGFITSNESGEDCFISFRFGSG
jgi:tRNA pseudouridine-54 N-methylase